VSASTADGPRSGFGGRRALAWTVFALAAGVALWGVVGVAKDMIDGDRGVSWAVSQSSVVIPAFTYSVVGLVVALRRSTNPVGWLMLVIGLGWSVVVVPASGPEPAYFSSMAWVLPFGLQGTHLLLRLPNGRLLTTRWRWVSRLATIAIVLAGVWLPSGDNPPVSPGSVAGTLGLLLLVVCVLLSVASLVLRSRRADPEERRQIRWIALGASSFLVIYAVSFVPLVSNSDAFLSVFVFVGYAAIPLSIGFAIFKYRLYDIDVVIRKALVVAVLTAFFLAVYALVVGGVGALTQSTGNTELSFAAAAIVAVLFQPTLARARRFADRVVFGRRATPYEVLATFGEQLAGTYAADDVLPRTAQVLAAGVGADRAKVWLADAGGFRPVAVYPPDADPGRPDDHRAEVRHRGDLLGALSVAMPANDPMDPGKEKLIADLAAQAGLVLRNVRLVEDLKASRRRLVSAQDEERRKLERNIHDGAQQQLVALAVKARLTRALTERDPAKASEMLEQIEAETHSALEDLRDLARGIYPPLLADKGLEAALAAQARKSPIPVAVESEGIGRYPQEVEAAVYFSVLEALQNVAKYAEASQSIVALRTVDGSLLFSVTDDGRGFDPARTGYGTGLQGIADRLGALDGELEVTSVVGSGTTITGRLTIVSSDRPAADRTGDGRAGERMVTP
jgi:signal transduction histidine kinase